MFSLLWPVALLTASTAASVLNSNVTFSLNTTSCPGYTVGKVEQSNTGLTASLYLAGPACNAFGTDLANLTVQVTYEQQERLVSLSGSYMIAY